MIAFFQRCWKHGWFRLAYWSFCFLLPFVIIPYAWMNLRGHQEWRKMEAKFRAEGESLDPRDFESPPIPDEENFCAIPALKDIMLVIDGDPELGEPAAKRARLKALAIPKGKLPMPPVSPSASMGVGLDWDKWDKYLRDFWKPAHEEGPTNPPEAVLKALSASEALYDELTAGLDRPKAQWTPPFRTPRSMADYHLRYDGISPSAANAVALRARALAATGRHGKAHQGAGVLLRLARASDGDLSLVTHFLRLRILYSAADVAWDLCWLRAGTKEEFAALRAELSQVD